MVMAPLRDRRAARAAEAKPKAVPAPAPPAPIDLATYWHADLVGPELVVDGAVFRPSVPALVPDAMKRRLEAKAPNRFEFVPYGDHRAAFVRTTTAQRAA